ncbi:hypothetical protein CDCA_CDCA14G3769 [Cyanidium caldarium]|uniref:Methyltransferase domain-containing protein n=1 Tax=Cyanidium caldarium TaxID=2771 RepID=A0AAV9IZL3_CYACA|nr:hypothetical protein CDCA_CDCA14G3769 [Cyanidium caldarium]
MPPAVPTFILSPHWGKQFIHGRAWRASRSVWCRAGRHSLAVSGQTRRGRLQASTSTTAAAAPEASAPSASSVPLARPSYATDALSVFRWLLEDPRTLLYAGGSSLRSGFFLALRLFNINAYARSQQFAQNSKVGTLLSQSSTLSAQRNLVVFFLQQLYKLGRLEMEQVRAGVYKTPPFLARSPWRVLPRAIDFAQDLRRGLELREQERTDAIPQAFLRDTFYPWYYKRNFHYQTDGYFSADSARRYDFQVEVLFGGTADIMRRQALVPLLPFLRAVRSQRLAHGVGNGARFTPGHTTDVLNVPCGAGSFLLDLLDNVASDMRLRGAHVVNVDLSPFYLREAERRFRDDSRLRALPHVTFLHANTEQLPLERESFDAVVSIYLFHELPDEARRNTIAEWTRVLRPGGRVVLADSLQAGDDPQLDATLSRFRKGYHEPFYDSYVQTDMAQLFHEASGGALKLKSQTLAFLTKVFVFEKVGVMPRQ